MQATYKKTVNRIFCSLLLFITIPGIASAACWDNSSIYSPVAEGDKVTYHFQVLKQCMAGPDCDCSGWNTDDEWTPLSSIPTGATLVNFSDSETHSTATVFWQTEAGDAGTWPISLKVECRMTDIYSWEWETCGSSNYTLVGEVYPDRPPEFIKPQDNNTFYAFAGETFELRVAAVDPDGKVTTPEKLPPYVYYDDRAEIQLVQSPDGSQLVWLWDIWELIDNPDEWAFTWVPDLTQLGNHTVTFKARSNSCNLFEVPCPLYGAESELLTINIIVLEKTCPVSDAGPPQTVHKGDLVTLDGSGSQPCEGVSELGFFWGRISGPNVTFSDVNSPTPTFVAPNVASSTTLEFELWVNDGVGNGYSTTHVHIINRTPEIILTPGQQNYEIDACAVDPFKLYVNATDPDSDEVTLSVTPALPNSTFTWSFNSITKSAEGVFSWSPEENEIGTHEITFTASDGDRSSSISVTLDVQGEEINFTSSPKDFFEVVTPFEAVSIPLKAEGSEEIGDITIEWTSIPQFPSDAWPPNVFLYRVGNPGWAKFIWEPEIHHHNTYNLEFKATAEEECVKPAVKSVVIDVKESGTDTDGDGIPDSMDTLPDEWSDEFKAGNANGNITRGDQILKMSITNFGVLIRTDPSGGATPAYIEACGGKYAVMLDPGKANFIYCGSATIHAIVGEIWIGFTSVDGRYVTINLPEDYAVTLHRDVLTIYAHPTNPKLLDVTIDGRVISVYPGETRIIGSNAYPTIPSILLLLLDY